MGANEQVAAKYSIIRATCCRLARQAIPLQLQLFDYQLVRLRALINGRQVDRRARPIEEPLSLNFQGSPTTRSNMMAFDEQTGARPASGHKGHDDRSLLFDSELHDPHNCCCHYRCNNQRQQTTGESCVLAPTPLFGPLVSLLLCDRCCDVMPCAEVSLMDSRRRRRQYRTNLSIDDASASA